MEAARRFGLTASLLILAACARAHADGYGQYADWSYPVSPSVLTLGDQAPVEFDARIGVPPFFILGADRVSVAWLRRYAQHFKAIGAIGFVIEASDESSVATLRRISGFDQLFLQPSDEAFATGFDIQHYPVLIDTREGKVMQ